MQLAHLIRVMNSLFFDGVPSCWNRMHNQEVPARNREYLDFELLSKALKLIQFLNTFQEHIAVSFELRS